MSTKELTLVLGLCLAAFGCGDDGPPPPPLPDTNTPDTGLDSAVADAGVDADSGRDADAPDTTVDPVDSGTSELPCELQSFSLAADPISRERPVSVAATPRGFMFGWGDALDVREQVSIANLASDAMRPMTRRLTNDDSSTRAVQVADGFAVWIDDLGAGEHFIVRGSDTTSTEPAIRTLSASTGRFAQPRLFKTEAGWRAFWTQQEGDTWRIQTRTFTADGEEETMTMPWVLASSRYAVDISDDRVYFAWNEERNIRVAVTDQSGTIMSGPIDVTDHGIANDDVTVSFALGFGIGAYGVTIERTRPEVRARLLNIDGIPMRPEQVISQAPKRGRLPRATAYARGYAVTYRATNMEREARLQLAFVHGTDGRLVEEYDLGPASFDGEVAGIAVDEDGGLAIGWATISPTTDGLRTEVQARRLECGDAWLRCGAMP